MKNFPAWREPVNSICVIALLKCIGSVGGVLSVQIYLAFIAPDQASYVLFLAVAALVIFLPGAPVQCVPLHSLFFIATRAYYLMRAIVQLRLCRQFFPNPERSAPAVELRRFVVAFVTVVVVIIASIGNAYLSEGLSHGVRAMFAGGILLLFSVIGLSLVFDTSYSTRWTARPDAATPVLESSLLGSAHSSGFTVQEEADLVAQPKQLKAGESPAVYGELNIWQTMATVDCWLMVFCTFATMASNGVVSVNIAQICEAAGRPQATPFLLTLYGTGSAIGRKACSAPFTTTHRFE